MLELTSGHIPPSLPCLASGEAAAQHNYSSLSVFGLLHAGLHIPLHRVLAPVELGPRAGVVGPVQQVEQQERQREQQSGVRSFRTVQ